MHKNAQHRSILLAALYDAREAKPKQGWLFENELCGLVEDPAFALEILAEQGYVAKDGVDPRYLTDIGKAMFLSGDLKRCGFKYRITAKGVLAHEAADN